jgi:hypothetical protein
MRNEGELCLVVTRSGGFSGMPKQFAPVGSDDLPETHPGVAAQGYRCPDRFFHLRGNLSLSVSPDEFSFTAVICDGDTAPTLSVGLTELTAIPRPRTPQAGRSD